jgi:hypothetical protein
MRLGISTIEGVDDPGGLPFAIAQLQRDMGAWPHTVPVWNRWHPRPVWQPLPARDLPWRAMVFVESDGNYAAYLRGDHDGALDAWAQCAAVDGRRLLVRFDQEPNGFPSSPWAGTEPATYRRAFAYVSDRVRAIAGNVRFVYCPIRRGRARQDELKRYYPGHAAQRVAFDAYNRGSSKSIADDWAPTIETLRSISGARTVMVCEFGRLRGTGNRVRWLRGLRDVEGVSLALYFHIRPPAEPWDWRMTARMLRAYGSLAVELA